MRKFYVTVKKVLFGFFLTATTLSYSQTIHQGKAADEIIRGTNIIRESNHSALPSYVSFTQGQEKGLSSFTTWLKDNFKIDPNITFSLIRSEKDQLGMTHIRYQQVLNGNPIEHGIVIIHAENGKVVSFNGLIFKEIPAGNASLSSTAALQKAKNHVGANVYKWELQGEEDHLKWEQNDPNATYFPTGELVYTSPTGTYKAKDIRLTYKFNIYAHEPDSRSEIFIDAQTGEVVNENEIIHHVDAVGSANTGYSGTRTITADDQGGGSFRLRETGRGNGIRTFNMQEGTSFGAAVDFTDGDNNWNNANAQLDEYGADAHWGAEMTYDYLLNNHARNSIDGNGFQLNSYVHYDAGWSNASWDGQRMRYGDGSNNNPFTALDIAGHEIGHGLTTNTANLVYQGESGGLNESFSDIIGMLVENYGRPSNWNWTIGEDLGFTLRNMQNPNSTGDPDTYLGNNWVSTALGAPDQGGVHTNSSVQNYWFYLTAMGGTGTNDNSDNYTVTAASIPVAANVAYRNLTVYLTSSSDYADARFYGIQSAVDIYGSCTSEVEAVTDAWHAVGVGSAYVPYALADFNAPIVESCQSPFTLTFNNTSLNGTTFTWDFGDGSATSSDFNPTHTYNADGLYTVTLDIDGGTCGTDQIILTDYIHIDPSLPCVVILTPNSTFTDQTECTGTVYDPGGPTGQYPPNSTSTITIAPTGASSVTLNFPFFDVEPGTGSSCDYDNLLIFDGPTTGSPLIGTYCNNNIPTTITSSTGAVTIRFITDPGLELDGFEMTWACTIPGNAPTAEFTVDNATSCTGLVQFTDASLDNPTSWSWDFGDGTALSSDINPTHTYTTNGTYTVTLTVTNGLGVDDEIKTSFITIATPAPPATIDASACDGESATLTASGSGTMDWYSAMTGGDFIYSGTTYITAPLTASVTYYVENNTATTPVNVGPADNSFGSGANSGADENLVFTTFTDVVLRSAKVYSYYAGYRLVEVRDNGGALIDSKTVFMPVGESVVYLNLNLPTGADMTLGCSVGSNPLLHQNDSGTSYPYTQSGLVSITSSTSGTGDYYYFYDWEVQEAGCKSYRSSITATMTSCLSIDENSLTYKIYPNPANSVITIEVEANQFDYELTNTYGQVLSSKTGNIQLATIDLSNLSNGIYFVKIKVGNDIKVERIVKN